MMLKNYSKSKYSQHGIALVIVLWMLALLTIIALSYSSMNRTETLLIANTVHSAQARAVAERGIWLAVNDLLKNKKQQRYKHNSTPSNFFVEAGVELTISIQDETGKIDINKASKALLLGMLNSLNDDFELNEQLADAIIDWRDRNSLTSINGAEDKEYEASGYSYGAKDGVFNSIGELLLVKGMTEALYQKVVPLITIHSMQSRVRLSIAPEVVLKALPDLPAELLMNILNSSENSDTAIINSLLPETLKPLVFTSGAGNIYSVHAEAVIAGVNSNLRVVLALKKNGNRPITILEWKENVPLMYQINTGSSTQENVLEK